MSKNGNSSSIVKDRCHAACLYVMCRDREYQEEMAQLELLGCEASRGAQERGGILVTLENLVFLEVEEKLVPLDRLDVMVTTALLAPLEPPAPSAPRENVD